VEYFVDTGGFHYPYARECYKSAAFNGSTKLARGLAACDEESIAESRFDGMMEITMRRTVGVLVWNISAVAWWESHNARLGQLVYLGQRAIARPAAVHARGGHFVDCIRQQFEKVTTVKSCRGFGIGSLAS